jgi:hypothetical protein
VLNDGAAGFQVYARFPHARQRLQGSLRAGSAKAAQQALYTQGRARAFVRTMAGRQPGSREDEQAMEQNLHVPATPAEP